MSKCKKTEQKRIREKETVGFMIGLYCRKNHFTTGMGHAGGKGQLCEECQKLLDYCNDRSDHCPFMETKTFCLNCSVHCYKEEQRKEIRKVMRYSGPRMMLYHPVMAVRHLVETKREKKRQEK